MSTRVAIAICLADNAELQRTSRETLGPGSAWDRTGTPGRSGHTFQPPTVAKGALNHFMLVPATGRVLFANGAGLLWNAFLSLVNSSSNQQQEEGSQEKGGLAKGKAVPRSR